jgi:hypothetical protein
MSWPMLLSMRRQGKARQGKHASTNKQVCETAPDMHCATLWVRQLADPYTHLLLRVLPLLPRRPLALLLLAACTP